MISPTHSACHRYNMGEFSSIGEKERLDAFEKMLSDIQKQAQTEVGI